jgi:hypothetical protein
MRQGIINSIATRVSSRDWHTLNDREIATKYDCSHTSVNRARKLTCIPSLSKRIYNFKNVDWSKTDLAVMRELGCCKELVQRERKSAGITPSNCKGRKGKSKWLNAGIDWSLDINTLAQIHDTSKENMGKARRRYFKSINHQKL